MEVEHSLFSAPSTAETYKGLSGAAGWAWGVVPVFRPRRAGEAGWGCGIPDRTGKAGTEEGAVRGGFLQLGAGFREDAGGNGDGPGSRRAKHWLVYVLAPLDSIMSGEVSGMEL